MNNQIKLYHIIILSIIPIFFMWLGYYSFPNQDDYITASYYTHLGNPVSSLWEMGTTYYLYWTGRYAAMIPLAFFTLFIDSSWIYYILPAFFIITLNLLLFLIIRIVKQKLSIKESFFWTLVISNLIICGMIGLNRVLYFLSASFIYFTGILGTLLYLWLFLHFCFKQTINPTIFFILSSLAVLYTTGQSEVVALLTPIFFTSVFIVAWLTKSKNSKTFAGLCLIAVIGCAFNYLAPGNFAKGGNNLQFVNLLFAIIFALDKTQQLFFRMLFQTPLLLVLLLILKAWPVQNYSPHKTLILLTKKRTLFALWLLLCFILLLPPCLAVNSTPPARVMALAQFSSILLVLSAFIYKLEEIKRLLNQKIPWLLKGKFNLYFVFFIISLLMTQNLHNSIINMANGNFATFRQEMLERNLQAQENPNQNLVFTPLTVKPAPVYVADLSSNSDDWKNIYPNVA